MGVGRFTVKQRIGAAPAGAVPRVSRVDAECGLCQGESGSGASLDVPWSRCLTGKCACHGDMGGEGCLATWRKRSAALGSAGVMTGAIPCVC